MEEYIKAGKAARQALEKGAKKIKPGARLLDVAEFAEKFILDNADGMAFPANISVNNQAAHYSPPADDETVFGKEDIVKLDVGAHVDGFIGDTALTKDLSGKHSSLVEASEKALDAAIKMVRPGANSARLGAEIERVIESYGFKPVRNLSGHVLDQWELHTGYVIPNVSTPAGFDLEEGMAMAIEPFASMGRGMVIDAKAAYIFSIEKHAPVRHPCARKMLALAEEKYKTLPFAERWLASVCTGISFKMGLRELVQKKVFHAYPVLSDTGLVSQAEKTVVVTSDGCEVTTK